MIKLFPVILFMVMSSMNPIMMVLIIISYILLYSINLLKMTISIWPSILMIMGFVGGMMILFLYSTSLSPNYLFYPMNFLFMLMIIILMKPMHSSFLMYSISFNDNLLVYTKLSFSMSMNLVIILLIMILITKIIFNPFNLLKSFYEKSNKKFTSIS